MEWNNATSLNWHFFFSLFWSLQIKRCWSAYRSARQQREGLSKTRASGTALTVFKFVSGKMQWLYNLNTHSKVNVSVPLITKERPKNKTGHSRAAPQAEKSSSSSTEAKIECPQCSKAYPHNKALQRHIRDQHTRKMEATISPGRQLKGACVDFEKGLFMISRTFSGVVYISHSLPAPRQCTILSQTSIHLMRAGWMRGRCSSNQTEWSSCFLNAYSYKVYSTQALLKNP